MILIYAARVYQQWRIHEITRYWNWMLREYVEPSLRIQGEQANDEQTKILPIFLWDRIGGDAARWKDDIDHGPIRNFQALPSLGTLLLGVVCPALVPPLLVVTGADFRFIGHPLYLMWLAVGLSVWLGEGLVSIYLIDMSLRLESVYEGQKITDASQL
jgi:hypothetical protein